MASSTTIKLLVVAATYAAIFVNNLSLATIPRPRGVPISKASLYHPQLDKKWQCLDGGKTIRFNQINDDYCDCPDGSDEPGTSACPNGIFYCANVGFRAFDIPTSRVDDFVCDCCDGSDETGTIQCPNKCLDLGRAEQEKRHKEAEIHRKGSSKRLEMSKKGRHMRSERQNRKAELERRRTEQNAIKEEKETLKKAAEAAEAEALEVYREQQREKDEAAAEAAKSEETAQAMRVEAETHFIAYDTNKDGFVEVTELQVDMTLDRDRNGVVTVEEAKYFLDERDRIDFENFLQLSWPRIKPMRMLSEGLFKPPKDEATQSEITEEHAELLQDPEGQEGQATAHQGQAYQQHNNEGEEAYEGEEEEEETYEEDDDTGVGSATPETTPPPEYDPETQRLIDLANEARSSFAQVENELREIDNEIKDIDEHNNRDYGANDEYAVLDGECFNFEDREYIYSFCPFARATQKPRNGGAETTLGRWDQWIPDGDDKYAKQKYTHGASCWNGPQRSVLVQFKCALENRLISVSEPNRCEYFYEFETPAACDDEAYLTYHDNHDEL